MKHRGTAALIALFFAGLIGLWVADLVQTPGAIERERQRGRILTGLTDLKPDDLRRIEIEGGRDRPTLVFERQAGQRWQMTAPLDVAANPSMVEGLAVHLKGLTRKPQADTLAGDPGKYGLAPPVATIRLWGLATDGPLAVLELGLTSLDRRYVRAGAAGIEVVPAQDLEVVDLPAARWRDRELFRVPTFEVDAVALQTPDRSLRFERGSDAWRIVAPIQALAEESKLEGLIATLGSLRITDDAQFIANDVPPDGRERYGLAQPSLTVRVAAGRGNAHRPEQVLEVGKPVEGLPDRLYARTGDQNDVVSVDARVLQDLIKAVPNDFRNQKVADVAPNRATRLRVEGDQEAFELARTGNSWALIRPSVGRADSKAVQEFFQALEGLRTTLYLPPSPATEQLAGLEHPSEVIRVWQNSDPKASRAQPSAGAAGSAAELATSPTFTIRIGNHDAGKKIVYAQVDGDTSILALPESMTEKLYRHSWAFRDRLILAAPTEQIDRIEFAGLGKRVTLEAPILKLGSFKNAATGWWMSEPVAAFVDQAAVSKLLKLLGGLRVDGYAAENPASLSPFGLESPTLKLTWSIPAALPPSPVPLPPATDPRTGALRFDQQTLIVGGPVPDRRSMRYAMLNDHPVVFILGGETLATLDAEWHNHQVFRFDPAAVDTIRLTWPGSPWAVNLARSAAGWSLVGPVDIPDLDPAAAAVVLPAVANLATTRYLQYTGSIPPGIGLTPPRLKLTLTGKSLAGPIEFELGGTIDAQQGYAAAPLSQPGAAFLVDIAPFTSWLKLQPALREGLPEDVFLREPAVRSPPAEQPGQSGDQPR